MHHRQLYEELRMLTPKPTDITRSTAMAAVEASLNCMAALIVVLSTTGRYFNRAAAAAAPTLTFPPALAVTLTLGASVGDLAQWRRRSSHEVALYVEPAGRYRDQHLVCEFDELLSSNPGVYRR